MSNVQPIPMRAQYLNQCMIETKRVFYRLLSYEWNPGKHSALRAFGKTRFFDFCQLIRRGWSVGAARGCARALRLCPRAEWTGRAGRSWLSGGVAMGIWSCGASMGIWERWREERGAALALAGRCGFCLGRRLGKAWMLAICGTMQYILDKMQSICYNDVDEGTGENEAKTG